MNLLPEPYAPPVYDCGKCTRCKAKLRKQKIRSIIFGTLWTLWIAAGICGAGAAAWSAMHPEPITAEQKARNERLDKIDTAMAALQNERDEIDPPDDDNGRYPPQEDEADYP